MYDLVIFNFVKLHRYSLKKSIIERAEVERTLIFRDSMRFGLRAPVARPKSVSFTWPVESTRKFCRGLILHWISQLFRAYLRFKIPVNVPELVQLANRREHFTDVESCVFLLEDARIVK